MTYMALQTKYTWSSHKKKKKLLGTSYLHINVLKDPHSASQAFMNIIRKVSYVDMTFKYCKTSTAYDFSYFWSS